MALTSQEVTAPFNNMQTPKSKAQPTNAFFATVNQMFIGSSQLPTTSERAVNQIVEHESRKLGGATEHLTDGIEKRICRISFEF